MGVTPWWPSCVWTIILLEVKMPHIKIGDYIEEILRFIMMSFILPSCLWYSREGENVQNFSFDLYLAITQEPLDQWKFCFDKLFWFLDWFYIRSVYLSKLILFSFVVKGPCSDFRRILPTVFCIKNERPSWKYRKSKIWVQSVKKFLFYFPVSHRTTCKYL